MNIQVNIHSAYIFLVQCYPGTVYLFPTLLNALKPCRKTNQVNCPPNSEFIFPGTHDSGTYQLINKAACEACAGSEVVDDIADFQGCKDYIIDEVFDGVNSIITSTAATEICSSATGIIGSVFEPFATAQEKTMRAQLDAGARAFDLRFFRAEQADVSRPPAGLGNVTPGEFYIHHTLIGPSRRVILKDIKDFLNAPNHEREVIIFKLFNMSEGNKTRMSDESLMAFYQQMFEAFGAFMAPRGEINSETTVREMLDSNYQVMVIDEPPALAPEVCPSEATPCFTKKLIWTTDDIGATSFSGPNGYPDAQQYDKESELFALMKARGQKRIDNEAMSKMWSINFSMGSDNDGLMSRRCFVCPSDLANVSGYCPAINDDWDEFCSLKDVAEYTNPKTISALVGLPRRQVNIIPVDHYQPKVTHEAYKLNKGAGVSRDSLLNSH